jgi:glycosyltransferase involved in cell wall biosynthesis
MTNSPAGILLVVTDSHIGGTEKMVSLLARGLDASLYRPVVCSLKPPGEAAREIREAEVEFFSLGFSSSGPAGAVRSLALPLGLAREAKKRDVRLIHSFLFLANIAGRLAASHLGLPHISSIRTEEREKGYHHLVERLTGKLVHRYVTPSESAALFAAEKSGVPRERVTVIPNAVEEPVGGDPGLRSLLGLDRDDFLVGCVGRLHRQKGVDLALEAFARLGVSVRANLVVLGDGPERESLEARARIPDLAGRVLFTGWIPGAGRLMGDLDLLLLPSRTEGMPNAALEAMAAGTPVAAAAVGGVPEIIRDGKTGFLFPPDDQDSLSALLDDIIRGGRDLEGAACEAVRKIRSDHSPRAMVRGYQDLYNQLLRDR